MLDLARFERDLPQRLDALDRTLSTNGGWFDDLPDGPLWVVPKRLRSSDDDRHNESVVHIGGAPQHAPIPDMDVQLRLTPSPEFAIVEVLFLWKFGPALESILSRNAIGRRLDLRAGGLSRTRRWLFEYWPRRYEEFRTVPIDAAIRELDRGHSVLLLSADLTSFYDTIDPSFLLSDHLIDEINTANRSRKGAPIDPAAYSAAAASLLRSCRRFQRRASRLTGLPWSTGIPIGTLTSHVVANLALSTLDQTIEARPNTRCYRRYVDDFVIVTRIDGTLRGDLDSALRESIPHVGDDQSSFRFDGDALKRSGSKFQIQKQKCKAYYLNGISGRDFLANVRSDFGRLLSERRAFLDPELLLDEKLPSLVRAGPEGRPLTVLRDVDRLRLEHFEAATRHRSLERVSVLVDERSARELAERALGETVRFLEGDEDWVKNLDVVLRMLRIGIRAGDALHVGRLLRYMDDSWRNTEQLRQIVGRLFVGGREIQRAGAFVWLRNFLHAKRTEAICSAVRPWRDARSLVQALPEGVADGTGTVGWRALIGRARLFAAADVRMFDREDDAFGSTPYDHTPGSEEFGNDDMELRARFGLVGRFTELCRELGDGPWDVTAPRVFLCTRPPSYFDVARRALYRMERRLDETVFERLLSWVNAIRGTEYRNPVGSVLDDQTVRIPPTPRLEEHTGGDPQLILGNLVCNDDYYDGAATRRNGSLAGMPILTARRLRGVTEVLARATERARAHRAGESLLVLPELSLPRAWFREVATYVTRHGRFGLIVGLEYLHDRTAPTVVNQAYAVIPGPFRSAATWPWTKGYPAREEAAVLQGRGLAYRQQAPGQQRRRIVIDSVYGRVSVLICSELIETRKVADLLARVEVVAVPSWNRDTFSYDHLMRTAGLQLNAIIGVANNGHYSDCRAWAPREVRWQRDLCRLIERDVDGVIGVPIPLASLRAWRNGNGSGWRTLPPDWA